MFYYLRYKFRQISKIHASYKYIVNYFTFSIFLLTLLAVFSLSEKRENYAKKPQNKDWKPDS